MGGRAMKGGPTRRPASASASRHSWRIWLGLALCLGFLGGVGWAWGTRSVPPPPAPKGEGLSASGRLTPSGQTPATGPSPEIVVPVARAPVPSPEGDGMPSKPATPEPIPGFTSRLEALGREPQIQDRFLMDLPYLNPEQLLEFLQWDREQTRGSEWIWAYGDDFELRLARALFDSIRDFPMEPARAQAFADLLLNEHWHHLTDAELGSLQRIWASHQDEGMRERARRIAQELRVRIARRGQPGE